MKNTKHTYTLKDAEFGFLNHRYNFSQDLELEPTFGGFKIYMKNMYLGKAEKENALKIVNILLNGIDGLSGKEEILARKTLLKELVK